MRGVVDDVKTTGVSPWITKKSLSSKKINAPFEAQSNSNAWIMGFPVDGIRRDLHRVSSSHRCTYCGFGGASIGCSKRRCTVEFHMPCGLKNGVFFQHFGKFQLVDSLCFKLNSSFAKIISAAGVLKGGYNGKLWGNNLPLHKYKNIIIRRTLC